MSGLGRRLPTALGYGAVLLIAAALPWAGPLMWALLAALAYLELARLVRAAPVGGTLLVLALWTVHLATPLGPPWALETPGFALVVGALVALALELSRGDRRGWPRRAAWTVGGALWTGGLLGYLVGLGEVGSTATAAPASVPVWLLLALGVTWAADIAAYAVGSLWGSRKLAPRLSPGKTWEGTLAGFAAAALVAVLCVPLAGIPALPALLVALLAGPAALAGDLAESALKRSAGVKDSGTLLPGHGGVFDRIDSLLGVTPVVALAFRLAAGL